jgi:hypothetical protein
LAPSGPPLLRIWYLRLCAGRLGCRSTNTPYLVIILVLLCIGELLKSLANDAYGLAQLAFRDDQRWGKPDDVSMCRFSLIRRVSHPQVFLFYFILQSRVGFQGLTSTPFSFRRTQRSKADRPFVCPSLMTTALSKPLPRIVWMMGELKAARLSRKMLPSFSAF